ncbi:MAG TPA: nuclear transport factor 2 family protein [Alphaproteobacteria bacterium]|nr:nuclear transport factor 2 family protein [Alphaproteobacteria bacterium]
MKSQEQKKEIVKKMLDLAFNKKKPKDAIIYLANDFIQHNPKIPNGKEGMLFALNDFYETNPSLKWSAREIWTDGDYVIVHSIYDFNKETAVVDIFRFRDDLIQEHWDVAQEVPANMVHSNGMF